MKKLFALIVAVALVLMLAAVPAVADSSKLIDIYP